LEVPSIREASAELNVNCGRPSIKMIEAGKVAGPDNIPPEALRADPNIPSDILYDLFSKVWKGEEMPRDWNESYIVTLPKKGDRRECENYEGIPLISVVGKVLNKIILLRLQILRWLITVSSTFQEVEFDGSLLPLFMT